MGAGLRIAIRKFGPFESAIAKQFASFKAATGSALTLDAAALDLNPLYESLFTRGGLKDGTWDIAFVVTDWIAEAVEEGALVDLASYMRAAPLPDYPEGWVPSLLGFQQFGDAVYGTPYHDGPECFVYRRDLWGDPREQAAFERAYGYPLAPPATWAQFYDMARFFTRPAQDVYGSVFAAYPDGHNTVYDFCLQLWSRGGELQDAHGAITLDTPQAAAALDWYRRIVKDPQATYPNPETIDSVKSGALFAAGKVAMMVNWFGFAAVCEQPDSPVKGKVAITKLPAGESGQSATLSVYWLLAIGAGSRHKDEAYALLRHVCAPAMDKLTTLEGAIGCRLSTWHDPEVAALIPFYPQLAELNPTARTLPRSKAFPRLAHIVDELAGRALATDTPTADLLRAAQNQGRSIQL